MTEAPDFVEPFQAWRVWKVVRRDGEYALRSVVHPTLWPAGQRLTAECLHRRIPLPFRRRREHAVPDASCECGIYGATLEHVGQYAGEVACDTAPRVLGVVSLWGRVIECERGFRASDAYPARIYVPADVGDAWRISWEDVALGLWRYGVPVEPIAARAAEATHHLAGRRAA